MTSIRSGHFRLSPRNEPKGGKSLSADNFCASRSICEAKHVLKKIEAATQVPTLQPMPHMLSAVSLGRLLERALYSQWIWILWKQMQSKTSGSFILWKASTLCMEDKQSPVTHSAATLWGDVTADGNNPAQKSLGQDERNVFSKSNHRGIVGYRSSSCLSLFEGSQQKSPALLPATGAHHMPCAGIVQSRSCITLLIRLVISALPLCFLGLPFSQSRPEEGVCAWKWWRRAGPLLPQQQGRIRLTQAPRETALMGRKNPSRGLAKNTTVKPPLYLWLATVHS